MFIQNSYYIIESWEDLTMGSKPSKGLNMAKSAFEKRKKARQKRQEEGNVQAPETLIDTVADAAAETVELQNTLKEQNDANVLSAITSALFQTVMSNPLGNLMLQMQRAREIKKSQNANRAIADKASDVTVSGAVGTALWFTKKVSRVFNPVLWIINTIAALFGLGKKLLLMGEFTTNGVKYFGIGIKEQYSSVFITIVSIYLYLIVWRAFKTIVRLVKKVFVVI